jgi:hypothetical protein
MWVVQSSVPIQNTFMRRLCGICEKQGCFINKDRRWMISLKGAYF